MAKLAPVVLPLAIGLLTADFFGAENPHTFAIPDGTTLNLRSVVKADESSEELGGMSSLACGSWNRGLKSTRAS